MLSAGRKSLQFYNDFLNPDDKINQEVVIFPAKEHPSPNPENYSCNATRIPDDFYVHIQKI